MSNARVRVSVRGYEYRGWRRGQAGQRGAALLVLMTLVVVFGTGVLLSQLNNAVKSTGAAVYDPRTTQALDEAKAALIAWATQHPDSPGMLPWPDRYIPASSDLYDGNADCVSASIQPSDLMGRLPSGGEPDLPCSAVTPAADYNGMSFDFVDGDGNRLYYAVSQNLLQLGDGGTINPDLKTTAAHPWLKVRRADGSLASDQVAAVVISPGERLNALAHPECTASFAEQDRDTNPNDTDAYLDSVHVYDRSDCTQIVATYANYDSDGCPDDDATCANPGEDFIMHPHSDGTAPDYDRFNDRLVYITVDELMDAVEGRVLGHVAQAFNEYRLAHGGYPWLSTFKNPRERATGSAESGSSTQLTVGAGTNFVSAGVTTGDIVVNVTDGASAEVTSVSTTALEFSAGLSGSASFGPADEYEVRAPFRSAWSTREGHIAFIDTAIRESFSFPTSYTAQWSGRRPRVRCPNITSPYSNSWIQPSTSVCNNVVAPNIHAALSNGSFPVSLTNGSCDWNGNIDEASCTNSGGRKVRNAYRADVKFCTLARGCFRTLRNRRVTRTYTFPLSILGGTGSRTTANGMKSRDVVNGSVVIVRVKDTVRYRGQTYQIATGSMRVRPGDYRIAGMYFDVEDNDDNVEDSHETFPPWFFANDWHHFMYVKVAKAETADGSGTCLPGGETEELRCITLQISDDEGNLTNDRNDAEAVVVIAGSQVDSQDRTTLAAITDYFGNRNNQSGNDIVVRAEHRDDYNDRVRVVWPNPG